MSRIKVRGRSSAFAGVEHDAEGEGDAAVEGGGLIGGEVEDVAVEEGERAIEAADLAACGIVDDEVGAEEAVGVPEEAAEEGLGGG